ncbi:MAG: sodium:solute symporter family protein [Verrucomicrobia bacterium]|nr:sodium:solute symporter family protein [Verrucomicrobiota bacterium]
MNSVLLGVLIYIVAQLLVGVLVSRRIKDEADYLLAGRRLGLGLATFSFFATWFGAETCVSSAGSMYAHGLAGGSAEPFGYGACLLFMGFVFAAPLWRKKLTTLADLFRTRYSPGVERLAVLLMVPTSTFWAAAQLRAFGQVLDATAGVGFILGTAIATAVAMVYTVSGGLLADVMTDLIQGIAIVIGLVVMLFAVVPELGGFAAAWASIEPDRLKFFGGEQSLLKTIEAWSVPICGSVVAQELAARVIATRTPEIARRSAVIGGSAYILVGLVPVFLGLVGVKLFPNLDHPEQILPLLAQKHLSTFFYILFVGALVSAILSTVDSTLLAASALVSHNLLVPLKPAMSERTKVRLARAGVMVFAVIAFALALQADSIFELVENSSSFGTAGIFAVLVFGLFTGFGGKWSALATLTAGLAVWMVCNYGLESEYSFLPSLVAAFAVYALVGLVERRKAARKSFSRLEVP